MIGFKMRKYILLLLPVFICITSFHGYANDDASVFADDAYQKYTWQTFNASDFANRKIDLFNPDYGLLNAAIFYAVNEQREAKKLSPLQFSAVLREAASMHSEKMVELKFFNDKNKKDTTNLTPSKRVFHLGGNFKLIGENIGRGLLMDYDDKKKYAIFKQDPDYKYFFNNGKDEIEPTTYLAFAKKIVQSWMDNKEQKINLIYTPYGFMGCGVRLSTVPYKERKLPAAVVTAVFGGYITE